jgi:hypothetical protein
MKRFFLVVLVVFVGYASYGKINAVARGGPPPLHETSYVVVYGRDTCGITTRMLADLDRSGIPYEYKRVNEPQVSQELHPRMEAAGLKTSRYGLPVVDVNAEMIIRPSANTVAEKYQQFAPATQAPTSVDESKPVPPEPDAVAATQHLSDPLIECTIDGHKTFMFRSQCPK